MKFYESGRSDQVMPTGHMAHALPRQNFQPKAAVQVHGSPPPTADNMARTQAIIQALRGSNVQAHGLSPASPAGQSVRGSRSFLPGPR